MPCQYMLLCGPNILSCILCLVIVYGHFRNISVISCIALVNRYTYVNYRYLYLPIVYSGLSTNTMITDLNNNRIAVIPCIRFYILILTVKITVTKTPTIDRSLFWGVIEYWPSLFYHDLGGSDSSSQTETYVTFIIQTYFKLVKWRSGYVGRCITFLTQTVVGSSFFFSSFCFFSFSIVLFCLSVCLSILYVFLGNLRMVNAKFNLYNCIC